MKGQKTARLLRDITKFFKGRVCAGRTLLTGIHRVRPCRAYQIRHCLESDVELLCHGIFKLYINIGITLGGASSVKDSTRS